MTAGGTQAGVRFDDPDRLTFLDAYDDARPRGYIPEVRIKDGVSPGRCKGTSHPELGLQRS